MANIRFIYLYRDGGNYKQWSEQVFTNIHDIEIQTIDERIRQCLIDGEWFYADKWGVPDLHHYKWDNEIDHLFHEFDSVEKTFDSEPMGDISNWLEFIESQRAT
jgi:hypothetical protein